MQSVFSYLRFALLSFVVGVENSVSVDENLSAVGKFKKIDTSQKRCLSAARRTDYSENFPFFKREADAFQNLGLSEILFQIFNFKYRHLFSLLI